MLYRSIGLATRNSSLIASLSEHSGWVYILAYGF